MLNLNMIFLQASGSSSAVAEYIKQTAENTAFFPWDCIALIVAGFSMYYALRTWHSQRQTERNTHRLEPNVQKELLIDLCRHFYRNLVISYTIAKKIRPDFKRYPSEEHLLKMKVNLEDIHDELFYKQEESFFQISKLYLNLRNYNMELDIISDHLRNPALDKETKERDLKTLMFKCSFLTKQVIIFLAINRLENADPKGCKKDIETIRKESGDTFLSLLQPEIKAVRAILDSQWPEKKDADEDVTDNQQETDNVVDFQYLGSTSYQELIYKDNFKTFSTHFNEDVRKEMGKNEQGGEKVWLIDL